jgi:transcriptional regulator with XRE-family HTH domain
MNLKGMVIGQKIKNLRELKNFTQEYMAEKLQMSQSNYSRIESNEIDVPFGKLQNIAEVLEIGITDLIEFDAKYFFNNVHAQTINGNINNTGSSADAKLYQEQIELLKNEVSYLKEIIELLKNNKL